MRKLTIVLTLASAALLTGLFAWQANAQTWRNGAQAINAASQNFTPIEKAACGYVGRHCGPYRHWVCGPAGRCWCAPC